MSIYDQFLLARDLIRAGKASLATYEKVYRPVSPNLLNVIVTAVLGLYYKYKFEIHPDVEN